MKELFGLLAEYVGNALRPIQYRLLLFVQRFGERVRNVVNAVTVALAAVGIGDVIWQIGFETSPEALEVLRTVNCHFIVLFGCVQVYRLVWGAFKNRKVELWQVAYMLAIWAYVLGVDKAAGVSWLASRYVVDAVLVLISAYELSSLSISFLTSKSSPTMLFAGSFLIFVAVGTGLLLMPRCHYDDLTFLQALFTATSSVCVTGMSVLNIATEFTPFGHIVIIVLVQIGGLGVMTFTCFFALSLTGKGSLQNRMFIKDLISADNMSDIFQTLKHIMYVTFIIEALSAWALYYYFREALPGSSTRDVVFTAVFHSISSFCNAGYSNLPGGLANPAVSGSRLLHLTIALTVFFGGAGFPLQSAVINWVKEHFRRFGLRLVGRRPRPGSASLRLINASNRLTFYSHFILLLLGAALFLVLEAGRTQAGEAMPDRLVDSLFLSASARTAGFMYTDLLTNSGASIVVLMMLMWIGCAPMSTGGGIKVTTFAICVLNLRNALRGRESIEVFGRRVSQSSVQKAFATMALSFAAILLSTVALKLLMPGVETFRLFFESFSALSTVGLTMDLTHSLNAAAQLVVIVDMFIGRIGVMAFLLIFITPKPPQRYKYPSENIMI